MNKLSTIFALLLCGCMLCSCGLENPAGSNAPVNQTTEVPADIQDTYANFLTAEFAQSTEWLFFTVPDSNGIFLLSKDSSAVRLYQEALLPTQLKVHNEQLFFIGATAVDDGGRAIDSGLFCAAAEGTELLTQGGLIWYDFWQEQLLTCTGSAIYSSESLTALPALLYEGAPVSAGLLGNQLVFKEGDRLLAFDLTTPNPTPAVLAENGVVNVLYAEDAVFYTTESDANIYKYKSGSTAVFSALPAFPFAIQNDQVLTVQRQEDGLWLVYDEAVTLFLSEATACSAPYSWNGLTYYYMTAADFAGLVSADAQGKIVRYSRVEG